MEPSTAKIISQIAEIQIEALKKLKSNPKQIAKEDLMKLLEASEEDILQEIDNHIQLYEDMKQMPDMVRLLTRYQTSICSYILWKMESVWIICNQEGVFGAWSIILDSQYKFNPEYHIIL